MIELVTTISLWELIKHCSSWISNLKRAKEERKKESIEALKRVVIASRKTALYLKKREQTGTRDVGTEEELSMLWTELGLSLEVLNVNKLAEKCFIKGKHWENPDKTDIDYLKKSDVGLEKMMNHAISILKDYK